MLIAYSTATSISYRTCLVQLLKNMHPICSSDARTSHGPLQKVPRLEVHTAAVSFGCSECLCLAISDEVGTSGSWNASRRHRPGRRSLSNRHPKLPRHLTRNSVRHVIDRILVFVPNDRALALLCAVRHRANATRLGPFRLFGAAVLPRLQVYSIRGYLC